MDAAQVIYPEWVTTESERKMHDDFRYFLWFIWRHLKLKSPTRRQLAIAYYLQHGPKRRGTMAFRGIGKSWITAALVLWWLYRDPQERILVASANEDRAIQFNTFVRRLIEEIPELRFLRPRSNQRDAVQSFDVGPSDAHQAPSVRAVGIFGQLTGGRATKIVADDTEVPKNSLTEQMREKLAEAIKEFDAVLVPEIGEIVVLGTPQTEQSIYKTMRERGYVFRVWPARYPTPAQVTKYDGMLAPDILQDLVGNGALAGTSTEPTRFNDMDLAEREASYGRSGFALQFMLDTSLSDAERYPLKSADFVCMDVDDEEAPLKVVWSSDPRLAWTDIANVGFSGDRLYRPMHTSDTFAPYQMRLMVVDPSGRGGDETAWLVLYMLAGQLYLRAWGGYLSGYDEAALSGLADQAARYKVNHVLVESNFGDGMFAKLLEPYLMRKRPVTVEEIRASGQKELRIISDIEPVLNQHRVVIDAGHARRDAAMTETEQRFSLLYQLTHITKDRNSLRKDDRADCLAHGVRYFRDHLARDTAKAETDHKTALKNKALDEFLRNLGNTSRRPGNRFVAKGPAALRRSARNR